MSLPRYPEYKSSGVDWLGEVPGHWEVKPIKHLGRLKGGAGFPHVDQGTEGEELSFHKVNALSQATSEGVLLPSDNTISRESANRLGAFVFPENSVVFAKVGAALLLGRIRVISEPACLDNNMMGLVVNQDNNDVGFVRSSMSLVRFDLIANPGAVPSLNEGQIGNFPLATPPLKEQQIIAAFLDRETGKIDALIAEQRRLVELLAEKRQAVISHAVTKGLPSTGSRLNAPMKDSGIAWLGEVPAHWRCASLRWLSTRYAGGTPDKLNLNYWTEGTIPWINSGAVNQSLVSEPSAYITTEAFENSSAKWIPQGALVMALAGQGKTKGMVAQLAIPTTCNQSMAAIIPTQEQDARFLFWWLTSNYQNIRNMAGGDLRDGLNLELLGNIPCPLALLTEQQTIATFLDTETAKFDTLTAEANRAIALLQERRSALISAAVTGKIDVRGAVIPAEAGIQPDYVSA